MFKPIKKMIFLIAASIIIVSVGSANEFVIDDNADEMFRGGKGVFAKPSLLSDKERTKLLSIVPGERDGTAYIRRGEHDESRIRFIEKLNGLEKFEQSVLYALPPAVWPHANIAVSTLMVSSTGFVAQPFLHIDQGDIIVITTILGLSLIHI